MTTHSRRHWPAARRHYEREDRRTMVERITTVAGIVAAILVVTVLFVATGSAP